jgi:hypothetical protein
MTSFTAEMSDTDAGPDYPPDRYMPGDRVEVRYPKDVSKVEHIRRLGRVRRRPLIGVVVGRMTESHEPEVYGIGFESASLTRLAREYGEEDAVYYEEDAFHAEELVLNSRKRRIAPTTADR